MKLTAVLIGFMMLLGLNPVRAQQNVYSDTFSNIKALQVSPQGFVFVLDSEKSTLSRYKLDSGEFEFSVGAVGFGTNRFDNPNDLHLGAGFKLLVTDSGNQRVVQYDRNLQFLGEITSKNARLMNGWNPVQAVSLGTGEIWVLDSQSQKLFLFDENGLFRTTALLPNECRVNENSRLWVTEKGLVLSNTKETILYTFSLLGKYENFLKVDSPLDWLGINQSKKIVIRGNSLVISSLDGREVLLEQRLSPDLKGKKVHDIQIVNTQLIIATPNQIFRQRLK
ncbi:hypothetical protein EP331_11395 [bacterium]|nr:MAG: hypothetical protein EP331_11395 [bacterium]